MSLYFSQKKNIWTYLKFFCLCLFLFICVYSQYLIIEFFPNINTAAVNYSVLSSSLFGFLIFILFLSESKRRRLSLIFTVPILLASFTTLIICIFTRGLFAEYFAFFSTSKFGFWVIWSRRRVLRFDRILLCLYLQFWVVSDEIKGVHPRIFGVDFENDCLIDSVYFWKTRGFTHSSSLCICFFFIACLYY